MMEQYTNRENLKKLLAFLKSKILTIPDNQWFANELHKTLAPVSDARILDIHEQCIETILQEQANEFYENFIITEIRPQLIADYIKMEHWRRRNNIQEFCMALYQQIEAITNHLGRDSDLNLIWRNIRSANFLVDTLKNSIKVRWEKGDTIEKKIIYKPENYGKELKELGAMDKFKAILFLIVYKTYVDGKNKSFFYEDFNKACDIYMVRNLNHRGNIIDENKSERISYIIDNPTFAMCSLLGFYAHFVSGINKGYPVSLELVEFAELCYKSRIDTFI